MSSSKLRLACPSRDVVLSVFFSFLIAHSLHFLILIFTEYFLPPTRDSFIFDLYSLGYGFTLGFFLNSIVAASLVFFLVIGLDDKAKEWFKCSRWMCFLLPCAPLIDLALHGLQWVPYNGYRNLFETDVGAAQRLRDSLVPGFSNAVVLIPWGYRLVFVLLAAVNALFVFRLTRRPIRSMLVFSASYISVCCVIAFLSPSDVAPQVVIVPLAILALVAWIPNAFLIGRSEFTARSER